MAATIQVDVVSAEEQIFSGRARFVALPGEAGELGILPGVVTVLADTAIRGQDLDEAKAQEAKKRAEEALQNTGSNLEYATAQAELAYATAQISAIQRLRKLRGQH
jgi:F-type H+-transporting ATPase subunit epsilon